MNYDYELSVKPPTKSKLKRPCDIYYGVDNQTLNCGLMNTNLTKSNYNTIKNWFSFTNEFFEKE